MIELSIPESLAVMKSCDRPSAGVRTNKVMCSSGIHMLQNAGEASVHRPCASTALLQCLERIYTSNTSNTIETTIPL
jgi:hypothetical protein